MRYIGSKVKLLPEICRFVAAHIDGDEESFMDAFSGTNAVAYQFKDRYRVITNDLLTFSYVDANARVKRNTPPTFQGLKEVGIYDPVRFLQEGAECRTASEELGYYEKNYSPSGGAMYLSVDNAKRIDFVRETLDLWKKEGWICEAEFQYLLGILIQAVPSISNITGTYGAFLKKWDKRALLPLKLKPLQLKDNQRANACFQMDANDLVIKQETDILYVDPPYNNRQYASNYHLLENLATNTKPILKGKTRLFDWSPLKSKYCTDKLADKELFRLLSEAKAKHIFLSYNSEGIIAEERLFEICRKVAIDKQVDIAKIPYRKYKSKISTERRQLHEFLIHIRKLHPVTGVRRSVSAPNVVGGDPRSYIKSPLNYIGGKYRILNQIVPLLPKGIGTFVDLFSGGANVGINVSAEKYIFNDMNDKVNELFRTMQSVPIEEFLREVYRIIDEWQLSKTNESGFLRLREDYNKSPNPIKLYALAAYGYNYQFRFNSKKEFNNPFGRNRSSFSKRMESNLINFSSRLQQIDAQFTDHYFQDFDFKKLTSRDFVYMDPPYLITTGNYNDGKRGFRNWTEDAERELLRQMSCLTKREIPYALSNVIEHKGRTNEILRDFVNNEAVVVHEIDFNYDNASHNSKTRGSREVLITNYRLNSDGKAILFE